MEPEWRRLDRPADLPAPARATLDVALVNLDRSPDTIADVLDDDERVRAGRFVQSRDGRRFSAARGWLRLLLGAALRSAPETLRFTLGPWGKPALAPLHVDDNAPRLAFNLAHSGPYGLIGFGLVDAVGVDIECMRPMDDWRGVAERFAPGERAALLGAAEDAGMDAFFACWSRKEAVVKLWGEGLSADLDSFEVSTDPHGPARVLAVRREGVNPDDIALCGFKAAPDAWAALAISSGPQPPALRFWRYA